jgi:hypothetical protein
MKLPRVLPRSDLLKHAAALLLLVGVCASAQTFPPGTAGALDASAVPNRPMAAAPATPSAAQPPSPMPAATRPTANTLARPEAPAGIRAFGSQMFRGQFAAQSFTGFNPDYQLSPGDRVVLRLWGAFSLETTQLVDAQGNLFLPNIGPIRVQGVRNADLNDAVQQQVKRVYRANVQSYANLDAAQPVKIYVTGFVRQPGATGARSV